MGVRLWRDIPRTEIAEAGGVDPSMVTAYEKGASLPREDVLTRIARFLGVTPAYLRYGVRDSTAGLDPRVTTGELPAVDLQRTPQVDVFESQGIEKPAPPVEKGGRRYGNGGKR